MTFSKIQRVREPETAHFTFFPSRITDLSSAISNPPYSLDNNSDLTESKNYVPIPGIKLRAYRGDEKIDHTPGESLLFRGVVGPVLK